MIDPKVIEESILTDFGDNILTGANSIKNTRKTIISVSPKMDMILSGGIPEGTFVVITGPPKGGKSALALKIASNAQKLKRKVYYFDIEARIKELDIFKNVYLKTNEDLFTIVKSQPGNILLGEQFLEIAERLNNGVSNSVIILDSLSDLCTSGEYKSNMEKQYRADSPRLLGKFCRKISQSVPINNNIVIGITHLIANQGQGYSVWSEASGRKVQYRADVKLKLTHFTPWKINDDQIGQEIYWTCETSALGQPHMKTKSYLRYYHGIDDYQEYLDLAIDFGIVKSSKGWYKYKDKSWRLEQLREEILNNKKELKEIQDKIKSCML